MPSIWWRRRYDGARAVSVSQAGVWNWGKIRTMTKTLATLAKICSKGRVCSYHAGAAGRASVRRRLSRGAVLHWPHERWRR